MEQSCGLFVLADTRTTETARGHNQPIRVMNHNPLRPLKWRIALSVSALVFVLLQVISARIPPLQSPDEMSHLVRLAAMVEGELLPTTPEQGNTGGHYDAGLAALAYAFDPLIREANPTVAPQIQQAAKNVRWEQRQIFGESPGSAVYTPVIYAPAALGLAVGKALNLTILQSYHLARLTSHAACALMLGAAVAIFSPPLLAGLVLLLPMALFQMASPVIDGSSHALALLVLSMLWRLVQQGERVSGRLLVVWGTGAVVLITSRLHLLPMLLVPAVVAWSLREHKPASRAWLATAMGALLAVLAWTLWTLLEVRDLRVVRAMGTAASAVHYLSHPSELLAVLGRTLSDTDRLGFLWTSFLGNLGSLDTRLSERTYALLGAGLALGFVLTGLQAVSKRVPGCWSGLVTTTAWHRDPVRMLRLGLVLAAMASVLSVFLLLLWSWTPYPAHLIEGVQGRYFIAPALLLSYAAVSRHGWQLGGGLVDRLGTPDQHTAKTLPQRLLTWTIWGLLVVFAWVSLDSLWSILGLRYPEWARSNLFFS